MHCTLELPPVELRMYAGRRNDRQPTITPAIVPGDVTPLKANTMIAAGHANRSITHWRGYNAASWAFTISVFCLGLFIGAENTSHGRFKVPFLSGHHH